PKYINY
ncbi:hypothetical protein FOXB_04407, partial [Fusarium oxysporum f. sp. conglutinans Fo5176]